MGNPTITSRAPYGRLWEPELPTHTAVLVLTGGARGPGHMLAEAIAETLAQAETAALSVPLFGTDALPEGPKRLPLEYYGQAIAYLRMRHYTDIGIYGMSMGCAMAVLLAAHNSISFLILVAPTHVVFGADGHSLATWQGRELPYVPLSMEAYAPGKYYGSHTRLWRAFRDAYRDTAQARKALLPIQSASAKVLILAGEADEMWPAAYSAHILEKICHRADIPCQCRIYPDLGHLLGILPTQAQHPWLYRALPLISFFYRSLRGDTTKKLHTMQTSAQEILDFLGAQ